jgi:broad specificity phosphatase PhoE
MTTAIDKVRAKAAGHEAVCVSHQLPVEILRRHLGRKRLPHDPRRRRCNLASLTSFVYDGDRLVDIRYDEPAGS